MTSAAAIEDSSQSQLQIAMMATSHELTRRYFSSFSRMLDLGGAPSSLTERNVMRTVNASKNCKLQIVAFDIETLTRSFEKSSGNATPKSSMAFANQEEQATKIHDVHPDTAKVKGIANLLKVDLGVESPSESTSFSPPRKTQQSSHAFDIRRKYASKILQKAGFAGESMSIKTFESTQQEVYKDLSRGDADGHWETFRHISRSLPTNDRPIISTVCPKANHKKWAAQTGTGNLLQYLTHRSMQIVLLPSKPVSYDDCERGRMFTLQRQLKDVTFDLLVTPKLENDRSSSSFPFGISSEDCILQYALKELGREVESASLALLVSSRDEYLQSAKKLGWMTCRIVAKNSPRGNVSVNYMVESVPDVKDVVDEINGISFSAVLNNRKSM